MRSRLPSEADSWCLRDAPAVGFQDPKASPASCCSPGQPLAASSARQRFRRGIQIPSRAICLPSRGKPAAGNSASARCRQYQARQARNSRCGPRTRVARCWKCLTGLPRNPRVPSAACRTIHASARYGSAPHPRNSPPVSGPHNHALSICKTACAGFPSCQRDWAYRNASRAKPAPRSPAWRRVIV